MAKTREELLELLRQRLASCRVETAEKALVAWGFEARKTTKERALWKRGKETFTMPQPKGKHLKKTYVKQVIKVIEKVRAGEGA